MEDIKHQKLEIGQKVVFAHSLYSGSVSLLEGDIVGFTAKMVIICWNYDNYTYRTRINENKTESKILVIN